MDKDTFNETASRIIPNHVDNFFPWTNRYHMELLVMLFKLETGYVENYKYDDMGYKIIPEEIEEYWECNFKSLLFGTGKTPHEAHRNCLINIFEAHKDAIHEII